MIANQFVQATYSCIPISHMKERLSQAYVSAVAARAGVKLTGRDVTEYGVDGYFQRIRRLPNGKYKETGSIIQCQIKATSTAFIRNGFVVYDMKVDAYNKLVDVESDDPPTVFILYAIPPEDKVDTWLQQDSEKLTMQRCCYWDLIQSSTTANKEWKRIEIPSEQRFTPEALARLFEMLKQGVI